MDNNVTLPKVSNANIYVITLEDRVKAILNVNSMDEKSHLNLQMADFDLNIILYERYIIRLQEEILQIDNVNILKQKICSIMNYNEQIEKLRKDKKEIIIKLDKFNDNCKTII